MKKENNALALLLVIFLMLLSSLLAMILASVFANRTELAKGFYRSAQVFYINDMGMERAKQKLYQDWNWRPQEPPGYLEEEVDISGLSGYYKIYVEESQTDPNSIELNVESRVE